MLSLVVAVLISAQDGDRPVAAIPEGVEAGQFHFSPDGKAVAYAAHRKEQHWVTAGDYNSQPSAFSGFPVLLANGKDVVYAAFRENATEIRMNDTVLFVTGQPRDFSWRLPTPGTVSPDGKVVVGDVRFTKTGKSAITINGKQQALHAGVISGTVMTRSAKVIAFALETNDGHCVVVNDKPGPLYDWVTSPVLSADGSVVVYGIEADDKFSILQGDKKIPLKGPVTGVFVSPDGTAVGRWEPVKKGDRKSGERVVVGDREGPAVTDLRPPVFSADGKHHAYRAKSDGKWVVVIDHKTFEVGDILVDPVFLADGKRVGYGARQGRELWWKTLDIP